MSVPKNLEIYSKMVGALNDFYWDNSISPNETAAKLDEFASECIRLAKFIRDHDPALDRADELRNEAVDAGAGESPKPVRTED